MPGKLLKSGCHSMEPRVLFLSRIDEVTFETCPLLATGGTEVEWTGERRACGNR